MRPTYLACVLLLAHATVAQAETFPDISHLAFATLSDTSKLTVIDIDKDQVVGGVELGLKPSQIEISQASPVLAATDGRSNRVVLADLAAGRTSDISLSFPARRLLTSPDGQKLAVSDLTGGHVAVFSLPSGRALANLSGLPVLSDLLFAGDGSALFIASNDLDGLGVIDIAQGKMTAKITPEPDAAQRISSITRSANGRLIFARSEKSGLIGVIDLRAGKPLPSIQAGPGAVTATPSGSGAYLLLTNESKRSFSIVHGDDLTPGAELAAASGLGTTYTGWFDSVAFVPSADKRTLLVYDLWRMSKGGDISLPAVPGPGTVTADGTKLYLPLKDKSAIAVIDARNRRLSSVIALDGHPTGIAVGAGYGICH
ncbi:YncE family protein [Telmatospirillum siberiense]|uniref:YncE family protein n=1 Tax=Telmatospirillum siberiense TaxID=382514 RepID=A0A2N3PX14_9PROT|nr:hypothetical protein [Telmatospirillum siberiense]PKU24953.1 hypothetical protein CWS72_08755 [Telmatospirillum siberiense]